MNIQSDIPKTLASACQKYSDRIESVEYEGDDGYWIYMKSGWWNPHLESSMIHEHTVKACLWQLPLICADPRPADKR